MISLQMNNNPEAAVIVAGDFNHIVKLKAVFPKFHRYINFPTTRDNNTLDQVYCNILQHTRMLQLHTWACRTDISVNLIPAYKPLTGRTRPTTRTVQVWTEEASSALQDCFECTDWEVFKEGTDLDGYMSLVLSYLKFCTDAVLPMKTIKVFPNQKPWLDSTVKPLLKACDAAYRSGDKLAMAYSIA
ncbi:hypothetical protein L3Q82_001300 [Scortum barcoo]|uniref:Uncharacterized protein n=1 Tax=Scortum barcoo TaxID=214431 RepID=A0ACB8W7Q7_9TELE|nr:hypothetical protein L3Q82_001300 [Scortum barcoo]